MILIISHNIQSQISNKTENHDMSSLNNKSISQTDNLKQNVVTKIQT